MKYNKTISISLIIFVVFGIICAALFFASGMELIPINQEKFEHDETISVDGIDSITISTESVDVVIKGTNEELISSHLEYYSSEDTAFIDDDISNENYKITINDSSNRMWLSNARLLVYVPDEYAGSISIEGSSGEIEIDDEMVNIFSNAYLVNKSGDIRGSICVLDSMKAFTISGDVNLEVGESSQLKVESDSGDVIINGGSLATVVGKSSSGNVTLNAKISSIDYSSNSGNIDIKSIIGGTDSKVNLKAISGNINVNYDDTATTEIESTSGNVSLSIPENPGIFLSFISDSGNSSDNYNFDVNGRVYIVKTRSGDLELN